MKTLRCAAAAATVAITVGLAACSTNGGQGAHDLTEITYLTSFNTFGRDAYAYVALEKGYFADAGFDVKIQPGSGTVDVLKLVASGKADFGGGDFQGAAIAIANEELPAKVISVIQENSLAAIATAEGYGITEPKDLEGKRIADQPGSVNEILFPVYAEAAGIDTSKVEFVPAQVPSLPQLLASKQVDAIGQFILGGALIEGATKSPAVFLPYSDYLEDLYGVTQFASNEMIESHPEWIVGFNEALHKGLAYANEHPDEAGEILKKYAPMQDPKVAADEIKTMAPYTGDPTLNGPISKDRVAEILAMLTEQGAITKDVGITDIVDFDLVK